MKLLTASQLAKQLGLTKETVLALSLQNSIPSIDLTEQQVGYDLQAGITTLASNLKESTNVYRPSIKYTYQDYLDLPEDESGWRIEILDGLLVKDPSPRLAHQIVSFRLQRILTDYFDLVDHRGLVIAAPVDVVLSNHTVVQPDILYLASHQKELEHEKFISGAPELVVEIISPSSRRKDRTLKMELYLESGVNHYWLVDPDEFTFEAYILRDGVYHLAISGSSEDTVNPPNFPGLAIDLGYIWGQMTKSEL